MLTVKKFLCFDLETGGKFIGWFGLIISAICVPLYILEFIYFTSISCNDFMELVEKFFSTYTNEFGLYECNEIKEALVNFLLFAIAVYCCAFVVCFLLLRGIATKSHKKVLPIVVLEAITLIIHVVLLVYVLHTKGLCNGFFFFEVFACMFAFYFFIVLFSLYVQYRDETGKNVVNIQFNKEQRL